MTVRCRTVLAAALSLLVASSALAASVDLSRPHGNKSGCINKDGQEVYAEDMLLLTGESLVTITSACTFTAREPQADGSLTVGADCESEGEEGTSPATFVIKQSPKNPKILVISDDTGFTMGEVSLCK